MIHSDDHDEGHQHHHELSNDPHIWLDPVLDRVFAKEIKDKLIQKTLSISLIMKKTIKVR